MAQAKSTSLLTLTLRPGSLSSWNTVAGKRWGLQVSLDRRGLGSDPRSKGKLLPFTWAGAQGGGRRRGVPGPGSSLSGRCRPGPDGQLQCRGGVSFGVVLCRRGKRCWGRGLGWFIRGGKGGGQLSRGAAAVSFSRRFQAVGTCACHPWVVRVPLKETIPEGRAPSRRDACGGHWDSLRCGPPCAETLACGPLSQRGGSGPRWLPPAPAHTARGARPLRGGGHLSPALAPLSMAWLGGLPHPLTCPPPLPPGTRFSSRTAMRWTWAR